MDVALHWKGAILLPVAARLSCQVGPYDVGIIGGGCAGLFLAKELALRNCKCAVIEKTRQQAMLLSGIRAGYRVDYFMRLWIMTLRREDIARCTSTSHKPIAAPPYRRQIVTSYSEVNKD
ncbi:NAD(P)-binding protein [Streptomyces tendae]